MVKNTIIFDLEATCDDKGNWDNETIQIGAVRINDEETFNVYIKPIVNPVLTSFCTALTGITQDKVDGAESFPVVFTAFLKWAGPDATFFSWGYYDKNQFKKDCERHGLPFPLFSHRSLKHEYAQLTKTSRRGMKEVLKREGLELTGNHHDGLDDALNIAKIYKAREGQWG